MLTAKGVERVRVDALARTLRITRGSFYWHFSSRKALLDALLADWCVRNTAPFIAAAEDERLPAEEKFRAIVDIWLDESDYDPAYDPAYDAAIRDWARTSARIAGLVRRVDRQRIDVLARICLDLGYDPQEAEIRARVTYFHQVGYYALGLKESRRVRRRLAPIYTRVLLG
jgi:AcrR family transcriptional regulator